MKRIVAVVMVLAVTACSTPAQKITARLESAGVPQRQARCMGERLGSRLSYSQLQQLSRVVKERDGERLTVSRLARRLGDADPALVGEIVRTGLSCAI